MRKMDEVVTEGSTKEESVTGSVSDIEIPIENNSVSSNVGQPKGMPDLSEEPTVNSESQHSDNSATVNSECVKEQETQVIVEVANKEIDKKPICEDVQVQCDSQPQKNTEPSEDTGTTTEVISEGKEQVELPEYNSAYVLENNTKAYAPVEYLNDEQSDLPQDPKEKPSEKGQSMECEKIDEQYIKSTDNNFISQYESEVKQNTENTDKGSSDDVKAEPIKQEQIPEKSDLNENLKEVSAESNLVIEEIAPEEDESVQEEDVQVIKEETITIDLSQPTKTNVDPQKDSSCIEAAVSSEAINTDIQTDVPNEESVETTEIQEEYTVVEDSHNLELDLSHDLELAAEPGTEELAIEVAVPTEEASKTPHILNSEVAPVLDDCNTTTPVKKPRRSRQPTFEVPLHVLGHNISKPIETLPSNGRPLPKPRLGVKVPYRNLTSQIVSKAEIEHEIMERSRMRQAQDKGKVQLMFARSLTQRLAKKITSSESETPKQSAKSPERKKPAIIDNTKIQNDSDLLAILEGEGDEMPILSKEVPPPPQVDEANLKMLEREIALQQLEDLPHQAPKQRIFKGKIAKAPVLTAELSQTNKHNSSNISSGQPVTQTSLGKENASVIQTSSPSTKEIACTDLSPKKQPIEVEPQVKVNMVLKTYSRKRKNDESNLSDSTERKPSFNFKTDLPESAALPNDVYITKSSRIIKKKVIWDPDEIPMRSPKPVKLAEPKPSPTKIIKLDKNSNAEKPTEKRLPVEKEKKIDQPAQLPKKVVADKKPSPKIKPPVKPKKPSEIDKLLMDEGAVKMLYQLKNGDEGVAKKKKDVYSVEKAQKELIKKASQIKNELEQTTSAESAISLRKKEGTTPSPIKLAATMERKLSKDSLRSSVHTPPGSPFPSSMLIRRRSSSSLSSSDEMDLDESRSSRKKIEVPKAKKIKKSSEDSNEINEENQEQKVDVSKLDKTEKNVYNAFTIKKSNKQVSVNLNYENNKCFLTLETLDELSTVIKKFSKDKDCNVLCISSCRKAFCLGLDYSSVIASEEDERRERATKLADKVKDFLLSLLHFPKVLVAAIQGDCIGLGVTMLPLFDIVIASDNATFSTPYAKLGCIGEAGFLLSSPSMTNHGLAAELLYTGQKLTAEDAFRRGLISRLCWPEKYNDTIKNIVSLIGKGSKQSLLATKRQLQGHTIKQRELALNSETKLLIEHWSSSECQKKFSEYASDN